MTCFEQNYLLRMYKTLFYAIDIDKATTMLIQSINMNTMNTLKIVLV